jgi:hypothetical protein
MRYPRTFQTFPFLTLSSKVFFYILMSHLLYIVGATSSRLLEPFQSFKLKLPVLSTESALELQFAINLTTLVQPMKHYQNHVSSFF